MLMTLLRAASVLCMAAAVFVLVVTFKQKKNMLQSVIASTGCLVLSAILNIVRANRATGEDVVNQAIDAAFESLRLAMAQLPPRMAEQGAAGGVLGVLSPEALSAVKELYTLLFPSLLILNILFFTYAAYMIVKQILRMAGRDMHMFPKFSQLKLDRSATVLLAVSQLAPFLLRSDLVAAVFANIGFILAGVAIGCGVSYIDDRLRRRIPSAWFRGMFYLAVLFLAMTGIGVIMFGLLVLASVDSFFDLRGLDRRGVKNNGQ